MFTVNATFLLAAALGGAALTVAAASAPTRIAPERARLEEPAAPLATFTLFVRESPERLALRSDPNGAEAYWSAFAAYGEALQQAGVMVGGSAVELPGAGMLVRTRSGAVAREPAPSAGETLGGYFVIEAKDLAAAVAWAERCPAVLHGSVEVRPNAAMPRRGGAMAPKPAANP